MKLSIIAILTLVFTAHVQAQFGGLGKLVGIKPAADTTAPATPAPADAPATTDPALVAILSPAAYSQSADTLAGQALIARIAFLDAQVMLMQALGLKTDSVVKASEALRAKEGAASSVGDTVKKLNANKKETEGAKKEFDAALAKSEGLSDESKAKFAQGTVKFIEGVLLEKAQVTLLTQLVAQGKSLVASAGMVEKIKLAAMVKPVTQLAFLVPGDVKEGTVTLGKIMSFAKKQNIEIPSDEKTTAGLADLDTPSPTPTP